jgi:hypothetical protein
MSVGGAAVSADVQPEIGTPLAVGACVGRVVRHLHDGFAVKFTELQNRAELEWRVARPPPAHSAPPPAPKPVQPVATAPQPDDSSFLLLD